MKLSAAITVAQLGFSSAYLAIPQKNVNDNPPTRKDITSLQNEEFSLFVLAMQQWQRSATNNVGGYWQVAGIHGAPHQYWDGSAYQNTGQGNKNTGYCFHGTKDFYLWHRPYLQLFEQQMQATAVNIANNWVSVNRTRYQGIAQNLRMPYWDWARSASIPSRVGNSQVTITNSSGQTVTIANPLYSHTLVGGIGTNICPGNSRSGTTCRSSSAQSNMQNSGASLRRDTALLLNTANVCWNVFSTYSSNERRASGCSSSSLNSLEGIHNTVHNNICGTMCNLDTSAYDPIFWLHHCNVDRIGALWNYLNPNVVVTNTYSTGGNYVFDANNWRDAGFTYLPFRRSNSNTDWWTPRELYDVRSSGYTYPEIADRPSTSTLQSRVNAIYGTGRTQQAASTGRRRRDATRHESRQASPNLSLPPSETALAPFRPTLISRNGSYSEYIAECTIRKSVAPGASFNLHLFFGDIATGLSNSDYLAAPNRVGGFAISQAGSATSGNEASGVVSITDALLNTLIAGGIKDLNPNTIRKFVRARMVWRLVTVDGQNIGGTTARNSGLLIKVKRSVVTPDSSAPRAVPSVEAPQEVTADPVDNTQPQPVPSGVAPDPAGPPTGEEKASETRTHAPAETTTAAASPE